MPLTSKRLLAALVCLFGVAITWFAGHRGMFFLDQCEMFDGGWRILSGQVPYKDFYLPFGPVAFYIQAASFALMGVKWSAMVAPAAVMDGLAALMVFRIGTLLWPRYTWAATAGAFITAVCYFAPFGTLWMEQTAFFCAFLSVWLTVESAFTKSRTFESVAMFFTGMLCVAGFMAKQNAGAFQMPVLLAVVVAVAGGSASRLARNLALVACGGVAGVLFVAWWAFSVSDPHRFWHFFIELPVTIAKTRVPRSAWDTVRQIFFSENARGFLPVNFAAFVIGIGAALPVLRRWKSPDSTVARICTVLLVGLPMVQNIFLLSTNNDSWSCSPFTGLLLAAGAPLLLERP